MSQKSIILVIVLFALLILGMFIFAQMKNNELQEETQNESLEVVAEDPYADITRIDAKHYFIGGEHTLVGEISFKTPCDLLEVEPLVRESFPEQIELSFSVINNSDECPQIPTAQRFKAEAKASEKATFFATFMGRPVQLNLIPAGEGEVPEDFEIFIKG
ncbi:hypothetical protein H6785_03485 [Candidatus Nomurabacteria bacterium]|nr:hypothetical protein [Candidatus Nomurabacteria bacterium]